MLKKNCEKALTWINSKIKARFLADIAMLQLIHMSKNPAGIFGFFFVRVFIQHVREVAAPLIQRHDFHVDMP